MAFHLTVAGSLEPLADALATVLAEPLDDPFTPELIAVPGGGVQAWLVARLASQIGATGPGAGDGILANVDFVFPAGIVARAVGEGSGIGRWATGPLTWAVHEVLQELGPELGQATDAVRARAIADLFDRYTLYRPQMVRGWSEGRPVDGVGAPLDEHQRWQPRLWQAVQARLGGLTDEQLMRRATEQIAAGVVPADVPTRVVVFGLASLPSPHLEVLAALSAHREVHVLAPVASGRRWQYVTDQRLALGMLKLPVERSDETVPVGNGNPLVTGWGRASREANLLLVDAALNVGGALPAAPEVPELPSSPTLLQRLQHGVRADEAPPVAAGAGETDRRPRFDPDDDQSVRWHRAYGPARQVEVLRDALLHLFEETPEGAPRFEARDVAVLCPDPSRFAPLIEAVFAGDERNGVPSIPVRVADRSLRQDNPLLDTAAALLDLLEGRFRASSVIASRPAPRCGCGSASTPTRSPASASGPSRPTCGGASVRPIRRPSACPATSRCTRGGRASTSCSSAPPWPRPAPAWGPARSPCTPSWRAATWRSRAHWPSCSTGSTTPCAPCAPSARSTAGAPPSPTRWPSWRRCPTPRRGSGGRSSGCSRSCGPRPPSTDFPAAPRSIPSTCRPWSGPASPAAAAGPGSAPAR